MGYTHYWERRLRLPLSSFKAAVEDCRRLCQALPIPLGDAGGEGEPIFNSHEICFNGHIRSGQLSSIQAGEGLVWPQDAARGIAIIGEANAAAGRWHAGPAATARILGPDGDGSYETFRIQRVHKPAYPEQRSHGGWWFGFCKTNFRAYDLCVQCCLIILHHHLGSGHFRVSSDGTSQQWNEARDVCQHILGYGIDWGEGGAGRGRAPAAAGVKKAMILATEGSLYP
jgi:hypothetical protein